MKRTTILFASTILFPVILFNCLTARGQEAGGMAPELSGPVVAADAAGAESSNWNGELAGWEFFEINHDFSNSNWFANVYFEHDNIEYRKFDCWYVRTTLGYKFTKWLKADVAYDFMQEPDYITHRAVFDLTGTLKQGDLKVSIRERYIHTWSPEVGQQSDVLRSRLKVQYSIPDSRFRPYLAMEVFTWGDTWKKTRHYVATNYTLNDHFELEAYYLYYTYAGRCPQHILGIGLNMEF